MCTLKISGFFTQPSLAIHDNWYRKKNKTQDVWCKFCLDVIKCTDILNQLVETYFPSKGIFKKTQQPHLYNVADFK